MEVGCRNMAKRIEAAWDQLITTLADLGDLSRSQAEVVARLYRANKILKLDAVGGRYHVKHGAFFDRDTIRHAYERATH